MLFKSSYTISSYLGYFYFSILSISEKSFLKHYFKNSLYSLVLRYFLILDLHPFSGQLV